MTNDVAPKASVEAQPENLSRQELLALLRDVTEHRDRILSQFEAMAFQTDESAQEVAEARLEEHSESKRAEHSEHHAAQEAAHAIELSRQLEEERRKGAAIAGEFARFRNAGERAPLEDPWSVLGRAASQIVLDWVAWVRPKIPPGSPLLPWFDRAAELVRTTGLLLLKFGKTFFEWAKPYAIGLWRSLKREVTKRVNTEKRG